jgi:hypothetical protein
MLDGPRAACEADVQRRVVDCYNASINGHDPCYYNLGLLDDRSSSLTFTNNF